MENHDLKNHCNEFLKHNGQKALNLEALQRTMHMAKEAWEMTKENYLRKINILEKRCEEKNVDLEKKVAKGDCKKHLHLFFVPLTSNMWFFAHNFCIFCPFGLNFRMKVQTKVLHVE